MLKFRGCLFRDHPSREAWSAQTCRWPFRVEKTIPQEGICKGKICNHDSKAKWLLKVGRGETLENTNNGHTRDWGVNCVRICRQALHCVLGWFPHRWQAGPWDRTGAAPSPRVFQAACFRPGFPCCVPRKEPRSCWQQLRVLLVQGNIQRDFLIQSWREDEDFPRDPRLLGNAQQPLGLLRATMDQAGLVHQHSEEQHEYFRWAGANKSKWIEGLYPRTINKVHQN